MPTLLKLSNGASIEDSLSLRKGVMRIYSKDYDKATLNQMFANYIQYHYGITITRDEAIRLATNVVKNARKEQQTLNVVLFGKLDKKETND